MVAVNDASHALLDYGTSWPAPLFGFVINWVCYFPLSIIINACDEMQLTGLFGGNID
jgi:hypothetical protein